MILMRKISGISKWDGTNEVLLNFDINTSVGDEYIFAQEDIKDFFKKSPEFCNNFINYYFGE